MTTDQPPSRSSSSLPAHRPLPRQIRRREVFAFIAVVGEELHMPHRVEIREYHHNDRDWHVIDLNVGTEADVRWWAAAFGHDPRYFSTIDYAADEGLREGIPWSHYSSSDEWRGWLVSIKASVDREPAVPDEPLDEDTTAALREIAGGDPIELPEQCDECESTGVNCSLHSGPEWSDEIAGGNR